MKGSPITEQELKYTMIELNDKKVQSGQYFNKNVQKSQ